MLTRKGFLSEIDGQGKITDILFIYAKLNPDLGYRQGMHELLAPILWVVHHDAIDSESLLKGSKSEDGDGGQGGDQDLMLQCLDERYVEHDSFMLFCFVMQAARSSYEHDGKVPSGSGNFDVIPIVTRCENIHQDLLAATDRVLAEHLAEIEVLPQIFLTWVVFSLKGKVEVNTNNRSRKPLDTSIVWPRISL